MHWPEQNDVFSPYVFPQVTGSGLAFTTALKGPSVIEPRPPQPTSYVIVSNLNSPGGAVSFQQYFDSLSIGDEPNSKHIRLDSNSEQFLV